MTSVTLLPAGTHTHTCVCTNTYVCVFLFLWADVFIYTRFFRGVLIRAFLTTGFWKVYRESQPKADGKSWGFPTLVPVVSLLIS